VLCMGSLVNPNSARNPTLLVLAGALRAALFPIPVITIFWQEEIGMSLRDILLLQAIFAVTTVLLEFPSGYLADRLGYRVALITGALCSSLGWIAYAMGATFGAMIFAEIILAIGLAFTSGADSALLFVSFEEKDRASNYLRWEGRVRAASQVSEAVSSGIGGWLYSLGARLPLWLQVPAALAGLGAVAATTDIRSSEPTKRLEHLAHAWHIVRYALVHHARLRSAMMLSVALGICTYVAIWLIQPWMQKQSIPIAWFGPLWAFAHLWLAGVSLMSARIGQAFGVSKTLLVCCLLTGISYLGLGLSDTAVGAVFYLGFMTIRGLQGPLLAGMLQNDAPAEDRASVLSLNALLFRLTAAVALPPIGALADLWGLEAVLQILAVATAGFALAAWGMFTQAHAAAT
jgi:MFS family permease